MRFTDAMKRETIKQAKSQFGGEREVLLRDAQEKAEEALATVLLKKYGKMFEGIPVGYLAGHPTREVQVYDPKGHQMNLRLPEGKEFPSARGYYSLSRDTRVNELFQVDAKMPEWKALEKAREAMAAYIKELQEFEAQVTSVVYSATTVKKFIELWPEGAEFVPCQHGIYLPVPVDTINALNKKLGLKVRK